ncbi:MAG: NADH-quinone oxidoreductase subunit N [Acidimicrobiales bacterium]|nr:NADH-quinone oxidoreductase subunit N [Acidimicrobiales bacterium]
MTASVLAQVVPFERAIIDWHAVLPELILLGFGAALTLIDAIWLERGRKYTAPLAGLGLLAALVPVITLAVDGADRSMFGGAYMVDNFALIMKAMFLLTGYVVVLLSQNYISEGDYWENEYYSMLVSSILGMIVMASARDLITIFVALELLSIPAYLMATWRKRDLKSNEAGIKYYLMGVFASAVMLYGMSLLYGISGATKLADINAALGDDSSRVASLGVVFVLVGFAFKVSAVPFHTWAPDTYEGAPTPVTAFLAVASKAAGFVALAQLILVAFPDQGDIYEPLMWVLAVASMTVGNLIALRQTNMVRLMAYSGIASAGYIMAPLAVASSVPDEALRAMVTYLVIYAAMNLGVFAVILAVARKTRSAEISSYAGLFQYAPGLAVAMMVFLMALAGIPPFGGWWAKFAVFKALLDADTFGGYSLAVIAAVNSVIALFYYLSVLRTMWADDAPDGDVAPIRIPAALVAALAITVFATMAFGVYPPFVNDVADVSLIGAGR